MSEGESAFSTTVRAVFMDTEGMTLPSSEIQASLPEGWAGDVSGISREFSFASYAAGVAFAVHVALLAEQADHHPDVLAIGWKKVRVTYVTHSAGGVTRKDLDAAKRVNALLAS